MKQPKLLFIFIFALLLAAKKGAAQTVSISGIINTYTPVTGFLPCENKIITEDASTFHINDTVLIIQMKGALVDSANDIGFGVVTNYRNAGNYEINYVKSKTGNTIELKNTVTRQYNIPDGKVQLVRVPYYPNANVNGMLTCLPWDGNKGGVLVLNVADNITLNAHIDVSGRGFKGGMAFNSENPVLNCFQNDYYYPQSSNASAGQKGEGIAILSANRNYGKGRNANGGGGSLGHNSGGGGGSNAGNGGYGGYQLDNCGNAPFDNRGIGGIGLTAALTTNRLFLGGGGGAGQADNPGNPPSHGGNGGGIVILTGNRIQSNAFKIIANGDNGVACTMPPGPNCHDGMGGGGGGGTIVLNLNACTDNATLENNGGKGADMIGPVSLGGRIGSGGGGGGGPIFGKTASLSATIITNNLGGANGVLTEDGNNAWGATPGLPGFAFLNFVVTVDNTPFKPNIDSVRIRDLKIRCDSFDFNGLGYTNTHPVATWQWIFSDGYTANTQNTSHTFLTGNHLVKLVVTDINGCKDSSEINIAASVLSMDAGPADTLCAPASTVLQASATGATQYQWVPATHLSNPNLLNPVATPPVTTMYYLTASNTGCALLDSVLITARSAGAFSISPANEVCVAGSVQLSAAGGDLYTWLPASTLNNAASSNPVATPTAPGATIYTVQIIDTLCGNTAQLSTTITVNPLPAITASRSNDINCIITSSQLNAGGGARYSWTPAGTLNNPSVASPIAAPVTTTLYTVTGTDAKGCINTDTVTVKVTTENKSGYQMPTAFSPNNDGLNDCFGIKYWGVIKELEFSIYNRWGQRLFYTTNPNGCWDGRYNGVTMDPAVFVYVIKAKTNCEPSVFRKGTFALIR